MHLNLTTLQAIILTAVTISGALSLSATALGNLAKAVGRPATAAKLLSLGHDFQRFHDEIAESDPPPPPSLSASAGFARTSVLAGISVAIMCVTIVVSGCATFSTWWSTEGKAEVTNDGITLVEDYALKGKSLPQIAAELGMDLVEVAKELIATKVPSVTATPAFATASKLRTELPKVSPSPVDAGPDAH